MPGTSRRRAIVGWAAGIALLSAAVYARTLAYGYVPFDDPLYAEENPHVRAGLTASGLLWALGDTSTGNWHPATWASLMLDASLGGGAATHHAVNLALHAACAVLVFLLLAASTGRIERAGFAGALFAVHPAHVESVAWISERKDVLCALLGLLAFLGYGAYARSGRTRHYAGSLACFGSSLASKPMLVTLPLLLPLARYWPLRTSAPRGRDALPPLADTVPFAILAAGGAAAAMVSQRAGGAVAGLAVLPWGARIANAVAAYGAYLRTALWPSGLSPLYGLPPAGPSLAAILGGGAVVAGLVLLALLARRRAPWLTFGALWFLVLPLPVLGLVQIGVQSRADRYLYLAIAGPAAAIVWAVAEAVPRRGLKRALGVLAVGALAAAAFRQTAYWRDGVALFGRAVAVEPWNARARHALGIALNARGEAGAALVQLREAVALAPWDTVLREDLALVLLAAGRGDEAETQVREGLSYAPGAPRLLVAGGRLRIAARDAPGALAWLDEAARAAPRDPYVLKWRGVALVLSGRLDDARASFDAALTADPSDAELRSWRERLTAAR